jgi:hypothetical protein
MKEVVQMPDIRMFANVDTYPAAIDLNSFREAEEEAFGELQVRDSLPLTRDSLPSSSALKIV